MKKTVLIISTLLLTGCRANGPHVEDPLGPSHFYAGYIGCKLKGELIESNLPYSDFTIKELEGSKGYEFYSVLQNDKVSYTISGDSTSFQMEVVSFESDVDLLEKYYSIFYKHARYSDSKNLQSIVKEENDLVGNAGEVNKYGEFTKHSEVTYSISSSSKSFTYMDQFKEYEWDISNEKSDNACVN